MLCRCKLVTRSLSLFTCCVCQSLKSISCQPIYPCSLLTIIVAKHQLAPSPSASAPPPSTFPVPSNTGHTGLRVTGA